jgi:hypothetical protein
MVRIDHGRGWFLGDTVGRASWHALGMMTNDARLFPAAWTVEEYRGISYIVRDASNFLVAYFYFESEPGRRAASNLMTKDEARKIPAVIAKLPNQPKSEAFRRVAREYFHRPPR